MMGCWNIDIIVEIRSNNIPAFQYSIIYGIVKKAEVLSEILPSEICFK